MPMLINMSWLLGCIQEFCSNILLDDAVEEQKNRYASVHESTNSNKSLPHPTL